MDILIRVIERRRSAEQCGDLRDKWTKGREAGRATAGHEWMEKLLLAAQKTNKKEIARHLLELHIQVHSSRFQRSAQICCRVFVCVCVVPGWRFHFEFEFGSEEVHG